MSDVMAQRLASLRGSLESEEPGARGLERVARNPGCQRLRALTMVGILPATALEQVHGDRSREGQSPFALTAGNNFDRIVLESGAARLLQLYREAQRLTTLECKVAVVPELAPGITPIALERRLAETMRLFRMKLAAAPAAPNLIVKPRLPVPLLGIDHYIEPDVLVAADSEPFYRPVEIKSYPDRGGKTDPADVRSACRQAAVAVIGLRTCIARIGVLEPEQLALPLGDLVLRQPGSYQPKLRAMTLEGEVHSIDRAFNEAPRDLDELEALLESIAPNATLDNPAVLDAISNNYLPSCREYCALAGRCKEQAVQSQNPVLLGIQAREEFAAAGSLGRTLELLRDQGAPPRTAEERALREELQETYFEYRRAVGDGR
jgi:hypothetical protein